MSENSDQPKVKRERLSPSKARKSRLRQPRRELIDADGDVGYGKPPKAHRFKPGQSGNRKGRPKGSKNESTILKEVLSEKISLRQPSGRIRKIRILEGIHRKQAELALKGNTKSATFLLNRYGALVSGELQPDELSQDDQAVLEAFARRQKGLEHEQ